MELGLVPAFDGRLVGVGNPGPIRVEGTGPRILALHGFTGTPNEVRLVTEVAARMGRGACAPLLPGHGTHARDLQKTSWGEWSLSVDDALRSLCTDPTDRVVVCGMSMGAVLAAHLAATRPRSVAGLVLLANALWLPAPFPRFPLLFLERSRIDTHRLFAPKLGADITDPVARRTHLSYSANPIHGAIELLRAGRTAVAELGRITCPTLILHGRKDRVCSPANALRAAERLGTGDIEVALLPRSGHILTADVDRAEVAGRIEAFLRRIAPPDQSPDTPVDP